MNKYILLVITLIIFGCKAEYNEETLIEDILSNKSESIIQQFYKKSKLEREEIREVIKLYSEKINSNSALEKVLFRDEINWKKRPRLGYNFVNQNNNIEYSITYKFAEYADGKRQINYIDFRSSVEDLPCIKFPTKFPIRCIDIPIELPKNMDSLKMKYPLSISGKKVYHEQLLSEKFLANQNDTLNQIIAFNLGNKKISNNIDKIVSRFSVELENPYTYSSWSSYGEPTTYISYLKDHFEEKEIQKIKSILENILEEEVRVNVIRESIFKRRTKPRIIIGGIVSQAKVRACGIPGLTTFK